MDIYDIVLNFSDINNIIDFFEWKKEDRLVYVDKILVYKVDSKFMDSIINYKIKVNHDFLKMIEDNTVTDNGVIKYACLVGDNNRVYALEFSPSGEIIKISSLLLDEEDVVLEEISALDIYNINYTLLEKKDNLLFLTRRERVIRDYLLGELCYLYKIKNYDEISYLYFEIFNDKTNIQDMYKKLIDGISNSFNDDYIRLYEIVKMT